MIPIASPSLDSAELDRVRSVFQSGMLADGPAVREFETAFADRCEVAHGVATSNGTTALHTALHALDIGAGDRVITTPLSFIASANAIRLAGATPVFADVTSERLTLDPNAVRAAIHDVDGEVDAIIAVHLYGLPADLEALSAIAEEHDIPLIEDAAQAHDATVSGQPVGSVGDVACFSFYPTKNMTTGEGGMLLTDNTDVASRAAQFVNHGRATAADQIDSTGQAQRSESDLSDSPESSPTQPGDGRSESNTGDAHLEVGHNFRLASIGAAIGLSQLEKLESFTEARRANAERLTAGLSGLSWLETPPDPPGARHVYHQYTIQCADRSGLVEHLSEAGIQTGVYYPRPIHHQPAYQTFDAELPVAERAAGRVLSLPVHPELSEDDLEKIVDAVHSYTHD